VIRNFFGDDKFASVLALSHRASVHQYHNYVAEKLAFERKTRETLWGGDLAIDAVLAPVQAVPALPHGGCDRLSPLGCSTLIWNVVDSPVGVVPVTRVDPARDELSDEWRTAPCDGSKLLENDIYGPKGAYNPSAMKGLPVGVQVVGRPWEEEKVLAIMHVIDTALGPRGFGPGSWAPSKQAGEAKGSGWFATYFWMVLFNTCCVSGRNFYPSGAAVLLALFGVVTVVQSDEWAQISMPLTASVMIAIASWVRKGNPQSPGSQFVRHSMRVDLSSQTSKAI
jgi:hypothetical protein